MMVLVCSIFLDILFACSELGAKDSRDLSLDASGTKNFATFLVEMTQCVARAILPVILSLLPHMQGEVCVCVRVCACVCVCVFVWLMSKPI